MSFQYIPPSHDRNHGRVTHNAMLPSTSSISPDWRSQRSLYMGSSTPHYHSPVPYSPSNTSPASYVGPVTSLPQVTPTDQVNNHHGKILHPSSSYHYGNPGFYYDPLQFPVSNETQTSPTHVSYPNGGTHVSPPIHTLHGLHIPSSTPNQVSSTGTHVLPSRHPPQGQNMSCVFIPQGPFIPPQVDLLSPHGDDTSINNHFNQSPDDNNNDINPNPHTPIHDIGCHPIFHPLTQEVGC